MDANWVSWSALSGRHVNAFVCCVSYFVPRGTGVLASSCCDTKFKRKGERWLKRWNRGHEGICPSRTPRALVKYSNKTHIFSSNSLPWHKNPYKYNPSAKQLALPQKAHSHKAIHPSLHGMTARRRLARQFSNDALSRTCISALGDERRGGDGAPSPFAPSRKNARSPCIVFRAQQTYLCCKSRFSVASLGARGMLALWKGRLYGWVLDRRLEGRLHMSEWRTGWYGRGRWYGGYWHRAWQWVVYELVWHSVAL